MFGPGTLDPAHRRRSIYFTVKRSQLVPSMILFDAPDSLQGLGQRASTIVAPQALAMLNGDEIVESARDMARRLLSAEGVTIEQAIVGGYLTVLARPPDDAELADSVAYIQQATASYAPKDNVGELAMADFCQVLLSLNEFIYID
jgi:hypothetical protein